MKNIRLTTLAVFTFFFLAMPARAESCYEMATKRVKYVSEAEAALARGSYAVARSLTKLAESKTAEMRAKGCR
jgi:hypothetical protein